MKYCSAPTQSILKIVKRIFSVIAIKWLGSSQGEHLDPADTLETFEQSVADCYPEAVRIGWIEFDTATAIKELDPVSWEMAHGEWVDAEVDDRKFITFDNGSIYYWVTDIEQFIEDSVASRSSSSCSNL